MSVRLAFAGLALALALVAPACGSGSATGASAASVVPPDVLGYVELQADLEASQWQRVQQLLDRFPDRPQLVELLNEQLREEGLAYERDVAPALGETVVFVLGSTDPDDVVVLTQPDDDAKFEALLAKAAEESGDDVVTGEVDGWRAASASQANIDALADAQGSLAENDAFEAALGEAPDEWLAFGFVRGEAADAFGSFGTPVEVEWASGAVEAREDGAAVTFALHGSGLPAGAAYDSALLDEAPEDALAFLSFDGEALRSSSSQLAPLAAMLGVRIDELLGDLKGEGALWVRGAAGLPEFTLVVESDDPEAVRAALEPLVGSLPLRVRVASVGSRVVATTGPSPEAALGGTDESLGDSEDFRDAAEAAGMPDETSGFLFVDVADALSLVGLLAMAGQDVPDELLANLRPIRSVVAWSETDGDRSTQTLFVEIQ